MTISSPITPPPELVEEWANDSVPMNANAIGRDWEHAFATRAAQWGADQELEACCEWLKKEAYHFAVGAELRAARRPKPPSLKEQALEWLSCIESTGDFFSDGMKDLATIRRALEALDD